MTNNIINRRLESVLNYVNLLAGFDISEKNRHQPLPYYRALYAKIAFKVVPPASLAQIGSYINRDHSSILHYKNKLIPEIDLDINYVRMYNDFSLVNDYKTNNSIKDYKMLILSLESMERKYNRLIKINEKNKSLILFLKQKTQFTENELIYRDLEDDKKAIFDMRAKPILNMLTSKKQPINGFSIIKDSNISNW